MVTKCQSGCDQIQRGDMLALWCKWFPWWQPALWRCRHIYNMIILRPISHVVETVNKGITFQGKNNYEVDNFNKYMQVLWWKSTYTCGYGEKEVSTISAPWYYNYQGCLPWYWVIIMSTLMDIWSHLVIPSISLWICPVVFAKA